MRYRVRDFATMNGVTIKTLRHYERLGLLSPARNTAGQRLYSPRERDRLRRILALKRCGLPLARIRALLDASTGELVQFLTTRRGEIARQRARLDDTDRALALVEEQVGHATTDRDALSVLTDVTEFPETLEKMSAYFSDEAWPVARQFYVGFPNARWIAVCREIAAARRRGVDHEQRAGLLRRWNALVDATWRDMVPGAPGSELSRQLHHGFATAWRDRAHWPLVVQRRFADYQMDEIAGFLRESARMLVQ